MAVYRREYRPYDGPSRTYWSRRLVIPRYACQEIFQSRIFIVYLLSCLLVPLGASVLIYLHYNLSLLKLLEIPPNALLRIDATFFLGIARIQAILAFFMAAYVGPGLVSPDLTHNALPLYLSRPLSRADYVLGKSLVLVFLMSLITWLPLVFLFSLQGGLAGGDWAWSHLRILAASVGGSLIWILLLSLLALALSAWIRWKPIAAALFFGVFFVTAGFGGTINDLFATNWGDLLNLNRLIKVVWTWLYYGRVEDPATFPEGAVPVWSAALSLLAIFGLCIWLLQRRLRAYEVVR